METVRDLPDATLVRLTIDDLARVAVIDEVSISPDGETIAYCVRSPDRDADRERTEWCLKTAGGESLPGGAEGRSPRWSAGGESIAFVGEEGAEDVLLLSAPDGSEVRALTSFHAIAGSPAWSPDGERIAIGAISSPGAASRIAVVEVASGSVGLVPGDDGEDIAPAWSPDGSRLAFARAAQEPAEAGPTSSIHTVAVGGGEEPRPVESGLEFATCPSWSPDGRSLACFGTRERRLGLEDAAQQLWILPVSGGWAKLAAAGIKGAIVRPAEGPIWSGDGSRLFFKEARGGDINVVEATLGDPGGLRSLTRECQVSGLSASLEARRLAFSASTTVDPGSVYLHQAAGTGATTAVHRNDSALGRVPELTRRTFESPHGGTLDGWIQGLRPRLQPQPLVVCMHGGPHSFVGTGFQLGHFHRNVLASRGWAVLTLNSSGSGSYGEGFADSIRGCWGERDLPEYLSAVDELVDDGLVDAERLGVVGYSYGGYLSAWAVSHTDRFKAAVVGAPISNLESFRRMSDIGAWYARWEMAGTESENAERFERLSPVNHADCVRTPTLILHGEDDRRCPIGQGEELHERIAAAGRAPVEIVRYPGADHLFYARGRPSQRLDYNRRILEWIENRVPAAR
jgi:dipeptidyl aminopeptidase/acylaminoacyl peptidase